MGESLRQPDPRHDRFVRLVEPHRGWLRGMGRRLFPREGDAFAAEVLGSAWEDLDRLENLYEIGGWLRKKATWVASAWWRERNTKKRDVKKNVPLQAAEAKAARGPSPAEVAQQAETRIHLEQALAGLPVQQRRIMELRLAGLANFDIALVLGVTKDAVNSAVHRALKTLRADLSAYGEPE